MFISLVRKIAKDPVWKMSCMRRTVHLLDAQGVATLQLTRPLPNEVLAHCVVLLLSRHISASSTEFKTKFSG